MNFHDSNVKTNNQKIVLNKSSIELYIKREDLIHPIISGNKFRKLKYNLIYAKENNFNEIVTFGGAFSNHIAATAFAGKLNGIKTHGIIRGDELSFKSDLNPTLKFARENGMSFDFVSREVYRDKDSILDNYFHLNHPNAYILPEGGTNDLAVKGCTEILSEDDINFDYICCSAGTGGTVAGIINSAFDHQKVYVFPALNGDYIVDEIKKFTSKENWQVISDYHFGGYAKVNHKLITFINDFYHNYKIPLDPIYTGKMVYGVIELIYKSFFPENSKVLLIHTGGLQGISGLNIKLQKKNFPQIITND